MTIQVKYILLLHQKVLPCLCALYKVIDNTTDALAVFILKLAFDKPNET